jgi:hypothetical protein
MTKRSRRVVQPERIGKSISGMFRRKADKPLTKAEMRDVLKKAVENTPAPEEDEPDASS